MSRTARVYGPNPRVVDCEPDSSINDMTVAFLIALNIAAFNTPKEKAMTQELLSTEQGEHLKEIRDSVYEEYETLRVQLTLEQAIQVLNDKRFKFEGANPAYIEEWIKDFESESATLTRYIAELKDSDGGRGERYYDCFDAFTVIAVAEKLLREQQ